MAALRPRTLLPAWASALLLYSLCWSSAVCQEEQVQTPPPPGFVTRYATPMANLNVSALSGHWYLVEYVSAQAPPNTSIYVCPLIRFYYDDNNTLLVEPYTLYESENASPQYTLPVGDLGVWDLMRDGAPFISYGVVDLSDDNRFLAVAVCPRRDMKECMALVFVRHIEDAGRHDELTKLHRRLVRAGVDHADVGYMRYLESCRTPPTPSPDSTGPSISHSEWTAVTYDLGNATNAQ